MNRHSAAEKQARFAEFYLDLHSGELRRNGELLPLPPQPSKLLAYLVSHSGRLVTREELQRQLWSEGTFVDFDQGLNFCIRQIRITLDDNADFPRFIETVPRRGYRFIAPVDEAVLHSPAAPHTDLDGLGATLIRASPSPRLLNLEIPPNSASIASVAKHQKVTSRWALAGFILVAIAAGITIWSLKPTAPRPITRMVIPLPPGERLAGLNQPAVALSPDGKEVVYVANRGGTQQLYLRAMDSLEARPIHGTEGAVNPFFSPDGQWLGFFAGGKLKKVSLSGGPAVSLADVAVPHGATWSGQGMIIFVATTFGVLQQVSEAGGTPQPLTRLEKGEITHRWPEFLPGGKDVLFAAGTTGGDLTNAKVAVLSVGTGERRELIQAGTRPRYALSEHLVYAQGGNLMAVPFDPRRLEVTGKAVPVVEGVLQSISSGAAQYSFSTTGSLVYLPAAVQSGQRSLVWVNRSGKEHPLAAPQHAYRQPRVSPDGQRVAVTIEEQETQLWLYDLSQETLSRLTFGGNLNALPTWTVDGKRIVYQSNREGQRNLFWQLADGSGGLERLTTSEFVDAPMSWSPDGKLLAFYEATPTTGFDLWVLRLSDRKAQPFLRTPFNESVPQFSPDGRWLAYVSNESGRNEIYVQSYPGLAGKWQISTEGGQEPVWNPNGRELFYRSGDKMMSVGINMKPDFSAGKPKVLFEGQYLRTPGQSPNYDVSRDGKRFLMLKPSDSAEAAPTQINVVLNWFEELKRRVPSGK